MRQKICFELRSLDCGGREKSVDERGFAESRFTSDLSDVSARTASWNTYVENLTIIVKAAPRFATILCLERKSLSMTGSQRIA